jgi:sn-glycerol 3-phosphate transport system substrate-binding protein
MRAKYLTMATAVAAILAVSPAWAQKEIQWWHAHGGNLGETVNELAAGFNKSQTAYKVVAVFKGSYTETLTAAIAAFRARQNAHPHIVQVFEVGTATMMAAKGAIYPVHQLMADSKEPFDPKTYIGPVYGYYSTTDGKLLSMPFNSSTPVLYWNKELFKEAGLDPNKPPTTWAEMLDYAKKLTKKGPTGNVTQWGIQVPSSGFPYWLFQGFTTQNDVRLMNAVGTETYYDKPAVIEALQFWVDLSRKHQVHPPGIVEWGTTPKDFFEKKIAMMWTTTGNLTNVRNNAKFEFGVAMLPASKRRGSPTGGGNFYIFKKTTPAEREAVVKFAKWATQPDRAAQWGIDTGYVAVTPAAWETKRMKDYVAGFPAAAVARDQLPHAVAELSTHENQRVTRALDDGLQAALTGTKTPEQAMKDSQREAERILKPHKK